MIVDHQPDTKLYIAGVKQSWFSPVKKNVYLALLDTSDHNTKVQLFLVHNSWRSAISEVQIKGILVATYNATSY